MALLMRELNSSDDESDIDDMADSVIPIDPAKPWLKEFNFFLNSVDQLADGQTIVQWWGVCRIHIFKWCPKTNYLTQVNAHRYPVWASLARDYLAIMASSVLSERAFSSAGITISKRRNRLKADIVEALQFLKCMIRRDIIFRETPSASTEDEDEFDFGLTPEESQAEQEHYPTSWDDLLIHDDDNMDID
jgi:hypothetical protein